MPIAAFAIPFFLFFMLLEYLVARQRKMKVHDAHDSIANTAVGTAERLLDLSVTGLFLGFYRHLETYGLFEIEATPATWLLLLLATDFLWYWYHRFAHQVNLFWSVHVVHHQSEEFNYTVSARITVFQAFVRTGFWALLPLLGFPAEMIVTLLLVHGTYPFFTHTRLIGKLGWLEHIFVTPSHHRVHHASNPEYLDKNYGDVLIIWDKLFGTFQEERADIRITYGLTHPLRSHSFLWQHFHHLAELFIAARHARGLRSKIKVFLGPPSELPASARRAAEVAFKVHGRSVGRPDRVNPYVLWQMVATVLTLFSYTLFEHHFGPVGRVVMPLTILITLINCGAIMEQRRWVFHLEFARAVVLGIALVAVVPQVLLALSLLLITALVVRSYVEIEQHYKRLVYRGAVQRAAMR